VQCFQRGEVSAHHVNSYLHAYSKIIPPKRESKN
jgi:hypothetical protein